MVASLSEHGRCFELVTERWNVSRERSPSHAVAVRGPFSRFTVPLLDSCHGRNALSHLQDSHPRERALLPKLRQPNRDGRLAIGG